MGEHDDLLPGRLKSKICQSVEVKNEERGEVTAVIATLNLRDKDGDLIVPGAFGTQDVLVSAYNHRTWHGDLPVGRGKVYEQGNEARADLEFFMDDDEARRHFRLIKNVGAAQEFSFGFDVLEWDEPDDDQRQQGVERVITKFKVYEVSPVFRGAGINTRTVSAKEAERLAELAMIKETMAVIDGIESLGAAIEDAERREARRKAREARARIPAAALKAADGNLARVHHRTKGWPPFDGIPAGHVVVAGSGRVYQRTPRSVVSNWTEVRT